MLPVMASRFYMFDVKPTLSDKLRYAQRMERRQERKGVKQEAQRVPSIRRSRRSRRSGYAFAHQEGFGRLITSGKIMQPRNANTQNTTDIEQFY